MLFYCLLLYDELKHLGCVMQRLACKRVKTRREYCSEKQKGEWSVEVNCEGQNITMGVNKKIKNKGQSIILSTIAYNSDVWTANEFLLQFYGLFPHCCSVSKVTDDRSPHHSIQWTFSK